MKEQIQADYSKITDFSGDWLQKLADKYQLDKMEILDLLDF